MPSRLISFAAAGVAVAAILWAAPSHAQDMNTLSRHLEHQQSVRVQDHQTRMRAPLPDDQRRETRGSAADSRAAANAECSIDALPPTERRAMEARFVQIDRAQGRAAAMAYVQEQGRQFRQRLIDDGVCT